MGIKINYSFGMLNSKTNQWNPDKNLRCTTGRKGPKTRKGHREVHKRGNLWKRKITLRNKKEKRKKT